MVRNLKYQLSHTGLLDDPHTQLLMISFFFFSLSERLYSRGKILAFYALPLPFHDVNQDNGHLLKVLHKYQLH